MKKIISLATVALLAVSAQSASINWGNTTSSLIRDLSGTAMTSAMATTAGFTITLMYLDNGMDSYPGVASVGAAVTPASFGKTPGALQSASDSYTFGTDYTTGDQFFIRATATFGGQDYYMDIFEGNTYGNTWAIAGTDNSAGDTFAWTAGTYGGPAGTAGTSGTWVPVPEPATAALALAGLAMLIRRRK